MRFAPSSVSRATIGFATGALALAASCGGSRTPTTGSTPAPSSTAAPQVQALNQDCPAGMTGLQIGYSETERGASIVFTIPPPQHQSLQLGARRMVEAERKDQHSRAAAAMSALDAGGARAAGGGLIAPDLESHEALPSPAPSAAPPAVRDEGPVPSPAAPEPMPPATVRMLEVPTGAVVAYEAADPESIKAVRDHVRQRVRIMQLGQCPAGLRGQARP